MGVPHRIGASRLQHISQILQTQVPFFFEGAPRCAPGLRLRIALGRLSSLVSADDAPVLVRRGLGIPDVRDVAGQLPGTEGLARVPNGLAVD
jgi:hypothetical protein